MDSPTSLVQALTEDFEDPEICILYKDIFGLCTPFSLGKRLLGLLEPEIGAIKGSLFTAISIGAVFGFETSDGPKIVFKVYPKRFTKQSLEKIHSCQHRFFSLGYPAPETLSELIRVGPGLYGVVQAYISGKREDGHKPEIRKALAAGLAEFSTIVETETFPPIENPFQAKSKRVLWPTPHKSTIRLKETSRGAGFIRERALKARSIVFRHALEQRLAHLDWGVKNSRFEGNRLIGVFDWDSLGSMSEAEMVGQAAAQFTADWESPAKLTPSVEEAQKFVEEYQLERGKRFSKIEMQVVSAAADYLIALIARFEHAEKVALDNSFLSLVRTLGKRPFIEV